MNIVLTRLCDMGCVYLSWNSDVIKKKGVRSCSIMAKWPLEAAHSPQVIVGEGCAFDCTGRCVSAVGKHDADVMEASYGMR